MEKFSSFSYLVRNDFIYKDKVEVRVFFIYLDKGVVNKSLFLDKVNNKPERLYIADAKKIVNKMIENGSLEKYAEENIKHTKNKKAGIAFATVMASALVVAGASAGIYFAFNKPLVEAKVDLPEINGLVFDNPKAYVGKDYDTNISVNTDLSANLRLPDRLNKVVSGNRVLIDAEYTYTVNKKRLNGSLHIPGKYVEGDMKIELRLEEFYWYQDEDYINSLTKEDVTKEGGEIKTVEVNGQQHKVRLIGVDQDVDAEGNTIHTTWEFLNLISDREGHSLGTQWNDVDTGVVDYPAGNYLDSTIRKALNGTGGATHFLWSDANSAKKQKWSTDYREPVIDMLPEDLVAAMKGPKKIAVCRNADTGYWEPKTIETDGVCDKLFLLSAYEAGCEVLGDYLKDYSSPYLYYKDATDATSPKRLKEQVDPTSGINSNLSVVDDGQGHKFFIINQGGRFAPDANGHTYLYYYRSVLYNGSVLNVVDNQIQVNGQPAYQSALPVAPAFCL